MQTTDVEGGRPPAGDLGQKVPPILTADASTGKNASVFRCGHSAHGRANCVGEMVFNRRRPTRPFARFTAKEYRSCYRAINTVLFSVANKEKHY